MKIDTELSFHGINWLLVKLFNFALYLYTHTDAADGLISFVFVSSRYINENVGAGLLYSLGYME